MRVRSRSGKYRIARLEDARLQRLKEVERELGVVLIAYEKRI